MATVTFSTTELAALAKQVAPLVVSLIGPSPLPPPVVTPPAAGTFYIFNAGVATNGNLDYSYGNQPWSLSYGKTVLLKGDAAWQPRMPGDNLDTTPYTHLTVKIRPTQPSTFISGMEMIGDVPIPGSKPGGVNIMQYGPNPMVVGQWNTYVIPLSAYGNLPGLDIYKCSFQHQAGPGVNLATDSTEFDALGFVP
jgi:hypothetical protein